MHSQRGRWERVKNNKHGYIAKMFNKILEK